MSPRAPTSRCSPPVPSPAPCAAAASWPPKARLSAARSGSSASPAPPRPNHISTPCPALLAPSPLSSHPVSEAAPPVRHLVGDAGVVFGAGGWLGAGEEGFRGDRGAIAGGELAGRGIDLGHGDSGGDDERWGAVGVRHLSHELGPDRQRGLGSAETDGGVVVEADPDQRQEAGRVADEPRVTLVVGGAGLARDV